ncbi:dTDP-glucose 4,6-dehydratase [Stutzerimonas nosocomialis]|uniref:PhoX family protein n=1 Tax=Stutzerimonas nosocomialis TaxID=1056496 RepID=UPI001109D4D3|nr:PhoX family phosphatase [Stutzerimonas nosocomialis]TLX54562.1 dTDP-glucose 4,6-dehydratase [Stutzerimonas nosocomialis]
MSRHTGTNVNANPSDNRPMDSVLESYLSRRTVLRGGLGAAIAMIAGTGLTGCFDSGGSSSRRNNPNPGNPNTPAQPLALGFDSIPVSRTNACVVAAGYTASVLAPWGQPINSNAAPWKDDGTNTSVDQANAMGMNHDGMHFFPINGSSDDGLLVMNHEYIENVLHPSGPTRVGGVRPVEEVRKDINAHGVAVVRITKINGNWQVVENDPLNRRFTTASVMDLSGPMRGTDHVRTPFSPNGTETRGTNNNCGNGYTPWGTYLTCEENWPNVFVNTQQPLPADQARIGIRNSGTSQYAWETAAGDPSEVDNEFARFNITPTGADFTQDYRNEASTYGYIVEIDPYNANTRAVKRTALGRFRHEGCWPGLLEAGKPVVFYSGDDAQNEYVYKFVSTALWDPADANPSDRLATGAKYMDQGTLYVARFDDNGTGVWLPLTVASVATNGQTLGTLFGDIDDIILNTRGAADALGATPMDRPEWTTVNPLNGDIYLTLTNNSSRTTPNAANPRTNNVNGHIIRWHDADDQLNFTWDIFVFGSEATAAPSTNRSGLTDLNQFASPDGMIFDNRGILWIQTDNSGNAVASQTNDQMLAVIPTNLVDAQGNQVPVTADNQSELRRFFIGPNGSEVTGIAYTPDYTSMFVNIQHPGNWPYSDDATEATPAGVTVRPRASTVVIQKVDGGPIGV